MNTNYQVQLQHLMSLLSDNHCEITSLAARVNILLSRDHPVASKIAKKRLCELVSLIVEQENRMKHIAVEVDQIHRKVEV